MNNKKINFNTRPQTNVPNVKPVIFSTGNFDGSPDYLSICAGIAMIVLIPLAILTSIMVILGY